MKPRTFLKLSNQIMMETVKKDRLVRRRTSQVEIAFDLYFQQLTNTQPDISFFFTNHVASSMHRYWPTIFPKDYEEGKFEAGWLKQWEGEIPHAVKVANFQLQKIIDYCRNTNSELIVCSSMGQGAVEEVEPINSQVLITNVKKLMRYIGLSSTDWEPKLAMAPRVVVTPLSEVCITALERLKRLRINGSSINIRATTSGDIRLDISLTNQTSLEIFDGDNIVEPNEVGIENVDLQDASGSYAYHIPEGIMMYYGKSSNSFNKTNDDEVDSCRITPSILEYFGLNIPEYMQSSIKDS